VTGRTEFIVEADPGIARVEVSLDDVPVAQDEERPFRLKVDVGPLAVTRTLKAVGLNDSGDRIGEAFLTINDSVEAFRVSINAPAETFVSGDQEIQLEVQTPPMRTLERVELYWKETRIATLTAAPFRRKYAFPTEFGYLRAVAVLDDGSTAEDARIFNAEGVGESVDVRAVALLATVTDDEGKRIEGLTEKDFEILDEGTPVSATVRHATDTPVTIGIAIDTSSSMRTWLFEALEIASGFVRSGEGTDDRMFVTAFDEGPRLVHEVTTDAGSLLQRILDLQANGGTSIFDGVVFALQQFQNVPGRKALLVISDGKEGMSTQTANGAIRTARAAAIPIFTLGPPGPIGQTMRTLADATGGVAFGPRKTDLPAIFARIRDDVRGQYLITFEPHGVKAGTWRNLRVRARRADLKVRTVSGYYAR
jgi:Ca-activated chloride channel family protein